MPIIFLGGIGFAIAGAIGWGIDLAESYELVGADGRATIVLEEGDSATVFAVWGDGRSTDALASPEAQVTVTGPDGGDVRFSQGDGDTTFRIDEESGIDVGSFEATTSGEHDVQVTFPDSPGVAPQAAVGEFAFTDLGTRIVRPIGIGTIASVGLFILLLVLRGSSKRRVRTSPQFQGPTPSSTTSSGSTGSSGPFV